MKKKIIYNEKRKKKICAEKLKWATAHWYCKKKKNYIAGIMQVKLQYKIVLQVGRQKLYCKRMSVS